MLEHRDRLLALARLRCFDPSEAEDCVHDAFVTVASMVNVRHETVGALLSVIVLRRATDSHRYHSRLARARQRLRIDASMSPEDLVCDRQAAHLLAQHARGLSLMERRALYGKAEGYKPRETAERYGLEPKSVHLALNRARVALSAMGATVASSLIWFRRRAGSLGGGAQELSQLAAALAAFALAPLLTPTVGAPVNQPAAFFYLDRSPVNNQPGTTLSSEAVKAAVDSPTPRSRDTTRGRPAPAYAGPPVQRQLVVSLPGPGGSVEFQRRDPNQSFMQSLTECLAQGISLDPQHAGCKPN